jgi:mono/diheme cytochrome c family protein
MLRVPSRVWIVGILPLALVISACGGVNMSGEPKIVAEREILPLPPATATPDQEALAAAAVAQAEPSPTPGDAPADDAPAEEPAADESPGEALPGDYELGQALYLDECAACHGAQDGVGPGLGGMAERAAERVAGMTATEYLVESIVDPGAYLVDGYEDVMPKTYGEDLTGEEIDSLVKFIVEFVPPGMAQAATPVPAEDDAAPDADPDADEAAPPGETLSVRGRLVAGTANGEPIPDGLDVLLFVLDRTGELIDSYETVSGENGVYVFEEVARAPGNIYLIQVDYADVPQGAQILSIEGDETTLTKDITLYERTTEADTIAVTWAQMLINYAPINEFGLEVWLRVELANTGDRIVTTGELAASGWMVSVPIELPPGAFGIQPMQSETSSRYQVDLADGVPVVKDTWPLRPGQVHTLTVAYYLPYQAGAVIDQSFFYPVVDGAVLMPNDTVEFRSDQFDEEGEWRYRATASGTQVTELQPGERIDEDDHTLVKLHELLLPVPAGERLVFELVGRPSFVSGGQSSQSGSGDDETDILPVVQIGRASCRERV